MLKKNQYKQKNIVIINNVDSTLDVSNLDLEHKKPVGILQLPHKRDKLKSNENDEQYPYPYDGLLQNN